MPNRATVTCSIELPAYAATTTTTVKRVDGKSWSKGYDSLLEAWIDAYYAGLAQPHLGPITPGRALTVTFSLPKGKAVIDADVLELLGFQKDEPN